MSFESVKRELEKARKSLLELTTRNRLLSIPKHKRAKLVRVIDEKSEEVYRLLVEGGKKYSFLAKPEKHQQEEEEEAFEFDYDSDYTFSQSEEDELEAGEIAGRHTDTKLQTELLLANLQKRLLGMHGEARIYIEEQGVNILYLALGQLKWYESETSDVDRYAPLLLVPVRLDRTSAAARFKLSALEEDVSENLTLGARLNEFGIKLPPCEVDENFNPTEYLDKVAEAVKNESRWVVYPDAIVLGFFSFSKFLMYRDLDSENWPEEETIAKNPLINALMSAGFGDTDPLISEEQSLDEIVPVDRLSHVVDADTSQAIGVEEVRGGKHLVIQGPPGTGKSQTITNLISTAVLDGKTVLFVAEKMAALDVVKRRLDHLGLGPIAAELHSHRTNKKDFLSELEKTLQLGRPKNPDNSAEFSRLEKLRAQLNQHAECLNELIDPTGLTPIRIIGNLTQLDRDKTDDTIADLPNAREWTQEAKGERENLVIDIGERADNMGDLTDHIWRGARIKEQSKFEIDAIIGRVEASHVDVKKLIKEAEFYGDLLYGASGIQTCQEFRFLTTVLEKSLEAPDYDKRTITNEVWDSDMSGIQSLLEKGREFEKLSTEINTKTMEMVWDMEWLGTRSLIAGYGRSLFRIFRGDYKAALTNLRSVMRDPTSFPKKYEDRLAFIDQIIDCQRLKKEILELADAGKNAFGNLWKDQNTDWEATAKLAKWISEIEDLKLRSAVRELLQVLENKESYPTAIKSSQLAIEEFEGSFDGLLTSLNLDFSSYSNHESFKLHAIKGLEKILEEWITQHEELRTWILFWSRTQQAITLGLEVLVEKLLSGEIPGSKVLEVFQRSYFRELYQYAIERRPELKKFDGETQSKLVEEFRIADKRRIEIARYETLNAHHNGLPKATGAIIGALGILKGEMAKKRKHMAIRKLMARAGSAIQAIKPVFMMSPLSVAQFLEPGKLNFDLIIFDEASQVRPVDALGAISRGQQLVVVGDKKQLPPSSFFSRIDVDDEDDDEDEEAPAAAGDMESILSLATARGLYSRMLRWHYRSRHDSLIAVSNMEFYDNNLFIIPSPNSRSDEYGLRFVHVADGLFDRGKSRKNKIEARRVANSAIEHARNFPDQSLGIAAFSVSQRDAIIDELEGLRRESPDTEKFFTIYNIHEPFFVKNLENVQGDERDVIFISVGYGRDRSDAMPYMNFGPINKEGGERRLNVLISRAKKRCEVYASITADDINLERSSKPGVKALKTFLKYAESGILGVPDSFTGREMDSPFEAAVKQALEKEGYTVHAQVGVAGFFIDLAVVDPNQPGSYILGIECDGASYHSARSARERDRQREAVLVDHGWTLHRIWSTDWFEQPNKQIAKVIQRIEARLAVTSSEHTEETNPNQDEIVIERYEPSTETDDSSIASPYEETRFTPPRSEIYELYPKQLAEYVMEVVGKESPVHQYEVMTRIRENWGLAKSGKRIKDAVSAAINLAIRMKKIDRHSQFLTLPNKEVTLRDRSATKSPGLKKSEYIPPQEIREAILLLAKLNHGIEREELLKVVAPLFGIGRTTADFRNRIGELADQLLKSGSLVIRNGFLVLPKD